MSKHVSFKIIFIPGGPGLSSHYLIPLKDAISQKYNASILKMERLSDSAFKNIHPFFSEIERTLDRKYRYILIGHSYGCEVALSLLARRKLDIAGLILVNWIPAGHSNRFNTQLKRIIPPDTRFPLRNERDFRNYFRSILPLYFYRTANAKKYENLVTSHSYSLKSKKIMQPPFMRGHKIKQQDLSLLYTIESEHDMLLSKSDSRWMKKLFFKRHATIKNAGHFSMLEQKHALVQQLLKNIADIMK